MRILADENFPLDAVEALRARGHDVVWIRTAAPGANDADVLNRAQIEGRIVVTFDKDFGELAFRLKRPAAHGVLLFRVSTSTPGFVARATVAAVESREDWSGLFAVVHDNRIRVVPLT